MLISRNIKTNKLFVLFRNHRRGKTRVLSRGWFTVVGTGLRLLTGVQVTMRLPRRGEGWGVFRRRRDEWGWFPWQSLGKGWGTRGLAVGAIAKRKRSCMNWGESYGLRQESEPGGPHKSHCGQQGGFSWGMTRYSLMCCDYFSLWYFKTRKAIRERDLPTNHYYIVDI